MSDSKAAAAAVTALTVLSEIDSELARNSEWMRRRKRQNTKARIKRNKQRRLEKRQQRASRRGR